MQQDAEYIFSRTIKHNEKIEWKITGNWRTQLKENLERYFSFNRKFDATHLKLAKQLYDIITREKAETESPEDFENSIIQSAIMKIMSIQQTIKEKRWLADPSFLYALCQIAMEQYRYWNYIQIHIQITDNNLKLQNQRHIQNLEAQIALLTQQANQIENTYGGKLKSSEQLQQELLAKNNALSSENTKKQNDIDLLRRHIDELQLNIKLMQQQEKDQKQYYEEQLTKTIQEAKKEVIVLKEQLRNAQELVENSASIHQLQEENNNLKTELAQKTDKFSHAEVVLSAINTNVSKINDDNEALKIENSQLLKENERLKYDNSKVHVKCLELTGENGKLRTKLKDISSLFDALKKWIERVFGTHIQGNEQDTTIDLIRCNQLKMSEKQVVYLRKIASAGTDGDLDKLDINTKAKEITEECQTGKKTRNIEERVDIALNQTAQFFGKFTSKLNN